MVQDKQIDLARQSLGRPVTAEERALADALEQIFAAGEHDLAAVALELENRQVPRPSGDAGPWTLQSLEDELRAANRLFDAAYEAGGVTRLA